MSDGERRANSSRVLSIGEVTATATVVKCMGRTYAAVAGENEVSFIDTTDITQPIQLGRARSRRDNGTWDIITTRNNHLLTTSDLLRAVTALRESQVPALVGGR